MALSRRIFASLLVCVALGALLALPSCGGSSSSSSSTVASVTVIPTVSSISVNDQQAFTANALNSDGNQVTNLTVTWASSDTSIATINPSGIATAKASGTAQITATVDNVTSDAATLNVLPQIASISISPVSASISVNGTQQFTATAKDAQGNEVSGVVFTWAIQYSGVATIGPNGLATGVSPGTTVITASAGSVTSPVATLTVTP